MGNDVRFRAVLDDRVSSRLDRIRDSFDRLGGKGSSASFFGNITAKGVAAGFNLIADAASKAVDFAFDSIEAFSQLEQATGAVESIFGDARGAIDKFAETAASKAGLSKRAVFEMASVIGAKLKGMGMDADEAAETVVTLEQRAADMAATFGGTTVEAIEAISSALTGERDPIEKYGVSIKEADVQARILEMGLANVTAEEKKTATAAATLDLIMQGTKDTTGKFAAETGELAGKQAIANAKMEDAQAVLGEKLAPLMVRFADFMIDVGIPALETLADWVGYTADGFKILGDMIFRADKLMNGLTKTTKYYRQEIAQSGGGGGNPYMTAFAEGGWAGLHGPEAVVVGDGGEPELIVPQSKLGSLNGGGGFTIQGVSESQLLDMVERGLFFRLRRASPSLGAG
jgi:hypothetical protein